VPMLDQKPESYIVGQGAKATRGSRKTAVRFMDRIKLYAEMVGTVSSTPSGAMGGLCSMREAYKSISEQTKAPSLWSRKHLKLALRFEPKLYGVLHDWYSSIVAKGELVYRPTGEPMERAFWQTAWAREKKEVFWEQYKIKLDVTNKKIGHAGLAKRVRPSKPYDSGAFGAVYYLRDAVNRVRLAVKSSSGQKGELKDFDEKILPVYGRRMVGINSGYIALVPDDTRTGDVVCLAEGGPCPYVLRKTDKANEYLFVGECYVHGIMNGEAWSPQKCKPIWLV